MASAITSRYYRLGLEFKQHDVQGKHPVVVDLKGCDRLDKKDLMLKILAMKAHKTDEIGANTAAAQEAPSAHLDR